MIADRYPGISSSSGFDITATDRKIYVVLYLKTPVYIRSQMSDWDGVWVKI